MQEENCNIESTSYLREYLRHNLEKLLSPSHFELSKTPDLFPCLFSVVHED
jgi:hypothetical protein